MGRRGATRATQSCAPVSSMLVDVDEIRRRVRRATISERRRGRPIVGVDHRLLRPGDRGGEQHGARKTLCYLPSVLATTAIALFAFGQPA